MASAAIFSPEQVLFSEITGLSPETSFLRKVHFGKTIHPEAVTATVTDLISGKTLVSYRQEAAVPHETPPCSTGCPKTGSCRKYRTVITSPGFTWSNTGMLPIYVGYAMMGLSDRLQTKPQNPVPNYSLTTGITSNNVFTIYFKLSFKPGLDHTFHIFYTNECIMLPRYREVKTRQCGKKVFTAPYLDSIMQFNHNYFRFVKP